MIYNVVNNRTIGDFVRWGRKKERNMNKNYENATLEILYLSQMDIVRTSDWNDSEDDLPVDWD